MLGAHAVISNGLKTPIWWHLRTMRIVLPYLMSFSRGWYLLFHGDQSIVWFCWLHRASLLIRLTLNFSTAVYSICYRWYLASLVFGKNCRKIGINTSGLESIKWWHQLCHHFMYSYAPIRKQYLWGDFPTSWIFIKNPLVTSSLFAFQIKLFSFS